ncbi:MAG: type I glyceraldehyde-3-phosphate dehydrogenase [Rickettsiales bacterium]|nr:type I glyceraldehyde-3-phosphate dehydrogenase [Rickettsiales bacterium]OUW70588.1 MAG: type I glyceraldehyde-3-phosphate dehydrogenase [Rickettsiales bacterium TMED211]
MKIKIAINGFGRIGRLTLRAILESKNSDLEIVAINDIGDLKSNIHLLKYDSVHGILRSDIKSESNAFLINEKKIKFFSEKDPSNLPWGKLGIDLVIESTGIFTERQLATKHLEAGCKKVLISAPSKDPDLTVVYGVNHKMIKNDHLIISNGSCTTNCLAPIAFLIEKSMGIKSGYMTTIHSVTGDQNTIDTFHKDLRRARNSSLSMIPTSTGAAKAVGEVLPNLKGKLDGSAVRVPTANVSLIDFCFQSEKETSAEEINKVLTKASENDFKNILEVTTEDLVSCDFNHNPHSSILDSKGTKVINSNFCRILSWYDNEWGFSNRLLDVSKKMFT